MGGSDDASNLIELTVEEHAAAHLSLYEQYGKKEDLCAYYMLSGRNQDPEFVRLRAQIAGTASQAKRVEMGLTSSELFYGREVSDEEISNNSGLGGKIQGPINAESGHMTAIQKLADCSAAGKKGGAATIASGKGAFGDPVQRLKAASNGGKKGGATNAKSGHLDRISNDYWNKVKSGEIKRVERFWITDGENSKLCDNESNILEGWYRGRTQKRKV